MKTLTQTIPPAIHKLGPCFAAEVIWSPDDNFNIARAIPDLDPEEWQAWQTEVRVSSIIDGELRTGSAYLGGTLERYGDDPRATNPGISGYLPQMIEEAAADLPTRA